MTREKILDDLARVAGGTVNVLSGLGQQVKNEARLRLDDIAERLDYVPRKDFERLEAVVEKLEERVRALERQNTKSPKPNKKQG